MYKVIIICATIDSKATEQNLQDNLAALPTYMALVNSNIPTYNKYFKENHSQIVARGWNFDALVSYFLSGYILDEDFAFRSYMKRLHKDYLDERNSMDKLDYTKLISMALKQYNYAQTKGIWVIKSDEEQRIVSLTSEINNLRGKLNLSGQAKVKGKGKPSKGKDGPKTNKKTKNKKNTSYKSRQKYDESWRKTPPKDSKPLSKMVGSK